MSDNLGIVNGEAWRAFCERMAVVGDGLVATTFPASERDRAEGYRHLAQQVACWLTYAIGSTDPERPVFFRSSDPVYQWGAPNADQVARRATIAGDGTYRISGTMGSCEEFVLQIKSGATQSGGADVTTEVAASELGLRSGDSFEIWLSAHPHPGLWFALEPESSFVHVRDYYFEWQAREPATFVIERIDTQGLAAPDLTPDRVAEMLAIAAHEVEHSVTFWSRYQANLRDRQELNQFGPPAGAARGVQDVLYSHAFVSLGDDEALVLRLDPSAEQMWDAQLYNRVWYEALDFRHRVTSLNHRLAHRGSDGAVTIVIANDDPGWTNWLDTEGRREVLATIRWWHPPGPPEVSQEVVSIAELGRVVPADMPVLDPRARREQVRRRAAHGAWRYRT